MIRSLAARCRVRAAGTVVGLVATVGVGVATIGLSDVGWHTLAVAVLVMLATAAAVVLGVGHLRLAAARTSPPLLEWGFLGAVVACVGLVVVGGLALLVEADPGATAITTWFTAVTAAGPVVLGAQGRREARTAAAGPGVGRPEAG